MATLASSASEMPNATLKPTTVCSGVSAAAAAGGPWRRAAMLAERFASTPQKKASGGGAGISSGASTKIA
jgi:hypothetical protein